jgi:hypothetical protein
LAPSQVQIEGWERKEKKRELKLSEKLEGEEFPESCRPLQDGVNQVRVLTRAASVFFKLCNQHLEQEGLLAMFFLRFMTLTLDVQKCFARAQ